MNQLELLEDIKIRMGGASDEQADRALVATLSGLGEVVRAVDLEPLAAALPRRYAAVLREHRRDPSVDLATFFRRVATREQVGLGYATEHAQAVCRALWRHIDEQARAQLSIALWPELLRPSLQDRHEPRKPHRPAPYWPATVE